ncbi:MAG: ureidoglycolate lyase [Acidobacteriota bacterium]
MSTGAVPAPEVPTGDKLIRIICLTILPMTRESFAPYGQMVGERGQVEVDLDGGPASVAAQSIEAREMTFDFLGRHMRTEQVFSPLGGSRSVIAVAPPSADGGIDLMRLAAFLIDGTSAFKLHRGTWHTSAFPLEDRASFLVLDRDGTLEEDYDLRDLKTAHGVVVEIVK